MYYIFSSNSNFTLKFCVVLCNNVEKSQTKNEENICLKFQLMQTFLKDVPQNL